MVAGSVAGGSASMGFGLGCATATAGAATSTASARTSGERRNRLMTGASGGTGAGWQYTAAGPEVTRGRCWASPDLFAPTELRPAGPASDGRSRNGKTTARAAGSLSPLPAHPGGRVSGTGPDGPSGSASPL